MTRLIVGPFNRVEGDLEVGLDLRDGRVERATVTAPLYRGFERLLVGRPPDDCMVVAPRICGICSVSQSVAAARALSGVTGLVMPANGRLAADLILACENAADHLTHFALFFMPDFARPVYADRPWFAEVQQRFLPPRGVAQAIYTAARARFLHVMGVLAGKWPHSLAIQPGGLTKSVDAGERVRLKGIIREFRQCLEQTLFAAPLDQVAALASRGGVDAFLDRGGRGDFQLFLTIAGDLGLDQLGRGPDLFLSHGSFGLWPAGLWDAGASLPFDPCLVAEDLTSAWMSTATQPAIDKPGAYSWCKAPRLSGRPAEVGALARHLVAGDPLAADLAWGGRGNVMARVVLRLVELARLVLAMEDWVGRISLTDSWCLDNPLPLRGQGLGLVEAARGALSHHLVMESGVIHGYQIIAPTTWNFSPRDEAGTPGPLEQALEGTPVQAGETTPVAVQHVVRSFDPCMVCTVH